MKQKLTVYRRALTVLLTSIFAAVLLTGCSDGTQAKATPELVDAVIQQMQESGKLESAVKAAIQDIVKERQEQAQERRNSTRDLSSLKQMDYSKEHLMGSPDAVVSMVEYADFECPFCKHFQGTPEKVLKDFGDKVNLVYRSIPLSMHGAAAVLEAKAAECAARLGGNTVFWPYANDLFHYSETNGKGLGDGETVYTLADKYKLDSSKFKACMNDPAIEAILDRNQKAAAELQLTGTPATFVYNHKTGEMKMVGGAQSAAALKKTVEDVLTPDAK